MQKNRLQPLSEPSQVSQVSQNPDPVTVVADVTLPGRPKATFLAEGGYPDGLTKIGESMKAVAVLLYEQGEVLTDLGLEVEQQYWKGSPQSAAMELTARIAEHAEDIVGDAQRVILGVRNTASGAVPRESTEQKQGLEQ